MAQANLLPRIWRRFGRSPLPSLSLLGEEDEWLPDIMKFSDDTSLSIFENNGSVSVEVSVAGLKEEDIEISVDNRTLWVKGQRSEREEDKDKKYYQKASRAYSYCTILPESVDENSEPTAVLEDGLIEITFKKKQVNKPKKIAVKRK